MTHITFGPLKANPDGTLNLDFDDNLGKPGQGEKNALALSTAARAHGVKSLLMLGGAGEGPNLKQAAVRTLQDAGRRPVGGGGGTQLRLDLDWEDDIVTGDLLALAQELRGKRQDILLTYPGPAIDSNYVKPD